MRDETRRAKEVGRVHVDTGGAVKTKKPRVKVSVQKGGGGYVCVLFLNGEYITSTYGYLWKRVATHVAKGIRGRLVRAFAK